MALIDDFPAIAARLGEIEKPIPPKVAAEDAADAKALAEKISSAWMYGLGGLQPPDQPDPFGYDVG